ncbi:MAG: hypothetical protein IPL46_02975 [Saprospiraceae bacterium]|nr:hypothetical protein [Saprospiraceae bacterium]
MKKTIAWTVHLYTASGGLFALLAVASIDRLQFATAMIWLMVCFFIDGTDGLLARRFKVKELLPGIEGKDIDYVTDFITYAFVPAYFVFRSDLVSESWRLPMAGFIILISAFYYGKKRNGQSERSIYRLSGTVESGRILYIFHLRSRTDF